MHCRMSASQQLNTILGCEVNHFRICHSPGAEVIINFLPNILGNEHHIGVSDSASVKVNNDTTTSRNLRHFPPSFPRYSKRDSFLDSFRFDAFHRQKDNDGIHS